jgi:hypothetical protein
MAEERGFMKIDWENNSSVEDATLPSHVFFKKKNIAII